MRRTMICGCALAPAVLAAVLAALCGSGCAGALCAAFALGVCYSLERHRALRWRAAECCALCGDRLRTECAPACGFAEYPRIVAFSSDPAHPPL